VITVDRFSVHVNCIRNENCVVLYRAHLAKVTKMSWV